ncbi:hypothetical protein [Deinococcus multiflagellatus]|uniref:Uncharacterized protein n=1 Tax=Deinococcus multiflagellatus TaxID=1656887 RepID=A0ABW1ZFH3_9DEIO|nr:hypothetical protein [Deinococcus multiflagellatus]MBZ9712993.1 hypothetical protein [Deinococcus multiflagellatus]
MAERASRRTHADELDALADDGTPSTAPHHEPLFLAARSSARTAKLPTSPMTLWTVRRGACTRCRSS